MDLAKKPKWTPKKNASPSGVGCPLFSALPDPSNSSARGKPWFEIFQHRDFRFEWHEFVAAEWNWGRGLAAGRVGLCVNLEGNGKLSDGKLSIEVPPQCAVFYRQGQPPLAATRNADEHHCFITIEFTPEFLQANFGLHYEQLHPLIRAAARGELTASQLSPPARWTATLSQWVGSMRHCPVSGAAQSIWFQGKALEAAAHLFFPQEYGQMLCTRTQRLALERIERAKRILQDNLQNPPPLDELAKRVSCSPYYLSRQFAKEGGATMQQYLRQLRMERAAELLRTGKCNVTEAALEVGYNSLSHFSSTFHETFGCCPGLYPLRCRTAAVNAHPGPES